MAKIRAGSIWLQEFWQSCVVYDGRRISDLSGYLCNALIKLQQATSLGSPRPPFPIECRALCLSVGIKSTLAFRYHHSHRKQYPRTFS